MFCKVRLTTASLAVVAALFVPLHVRAQEGLQERTDVLESQVARLESLVEALPKFPNTPPGSIIAYAGGRAPAGWFIADGRYLDRTEYANLFAAIGTLYGQSKPTDFRIPDLRGYFIRGYGTAQTLDSGRLLGSYQSSQNRTHSHSVDLGGRTDIARLRNYDYIWGSVKAYTSYSYRLNAGENITLGTTTVAVHVKDNGGQPTVNDLTHSHAFRLTGRTDDQGSSESRPTNIALFYLIKY